MSIFTYGDRLRFPFRECQARDLVEWGTLIQSFGMFRLRAGDTEPTASVTVYNRKAIGK